MRLRYAYMQFTSFSCQLAPSTHPAGYRRTTGLAVRGGIVDRTVLCGKISPLLGQGRNVLYVSCSEFRLLGLPQTARVMCRILQVL
ncbi:hypothetical protein BDV29DRAFT_171396 [Aspergillus leporis]|uniref:Uncharacterized protein n=1 Tax=Aspergillus leporis TaxID=41062 RepID=A0A5N5X8Y8_9EURO|nr:hypothetical protein BDV29DRAFT_171396 [Aspergillus leporis]